MRDGVSPSEADVAKTLPTHRRRAPGPRCGDDLCLQRRAPARGRRTPPVPPVASSWWSAAPWSASSRSAQRDRLSRRACRTFTLRPTPTAICRRTRWSRCAPAARASRARRSSRIAEDEHPEVTLARGDRVIFSSRTIPGNEKAVGRVHQRPDRPGHRGDHRPHAAGPCLRPSAPRRARADSDRLGEAADRHPGAWRGAASCPSMPRSPRRLGVTQVVRCAQWRPGAALAGPCRHHRRGAGRAALPGRHRCCVRGRRAHSRASGGG